MHHIVCTTVVFPPLHVPCKAWKSKERAWASNNIGNALNQENHNTSGPNDVPVDYADMEVDEAIGAQS